MADCNKHDASGQLSGYLYQVLSALLLLLKNKDPQAQICVERFDDVSFGEKDLPRIMVQTKHQLRRQGTLNDTSVDLWRTINSWCDCIKTNYNSTRDTDFIIITTAQAKDNTAASYLTKSSWRNWTEALKILRDTAKSDNPRTNQQFYKSFLSLNPETQENFVEHIYVYDNAPHIKDIEASIMHYVRMVTLPAFEERVYEKITGWWIKTIIQCLDSVEPAFVSFRQLQNKMFDIGSEYKADSLPIDVDPLYEPSEEELKQLSPKDRLFIEQLRLIELSNKRIKRCVREYFNAYQQRSQWVRESLLYVYDLTKYEKNLIDEWERLFLIMEEDLKTSGNDVSDYQKRIKGKKLFDEIEELDLRIRKDVSEQFIMRGTYHGLANEKKVGWHVDFMVRLCQVLKGEIA